MSETNFMMTEEDYLAHYGILRKSGRYPWGSGEDQDKRNRMFLDHVADLKRQGMSEVEIARGFDITVSQLRNYKSIAKNEAKQADISRAQRLKDHGNSNVEIGRLMGLNESSVRALLAPGEKDKADILQATSNKLKEQLAEKKLLDVGVGVERQMGISRTKLDTALAALKEEGYEVHLVKIEQLGTGKFTEMKVLAPPDTTKRDVWLNRDHIQQVEGYSTDGGRTFLGILPPLSISSKRVAVRYAEQGGTDADGVIYVRPGVKDVSIGASRYAQVRIAVDGTHYLKGMAVYKDDLPAGVDLMFNTNKHDTGNKLDAMKALKNDPDNPFGSIVHQMTERGPDGKIRLTSVMNKVGAKEGAGEEGAWDTWSRSLSSQMLSKQSPLLAKSQLDMLYENKQHEFSEINSLTNPAVKRKLLESFSDSADSAAVHLKAAALPRQRNQVILPVNSLKETEVYAPNFVHGERVVLIRFPHGGVFEIPELTVNNNHPEAKKLLGSAVDAIGIHSKVAARLSGADFDGDTVLVIPNNSGKIRTAPALEGLKNFDPQKAYPKYEGMKPMSARQKQTEMGIVSNLITDMTIRGANPTELARAVRHSMVVIDAEKHKLDYRRSYKENGIAALKAKYQSSARGGASTIVSRKKSTMDVPARKLRPAAQGGPIDKATGKLVYIPTNEHFTQRVVNKRTGEVRDKVIFKTQKVVKLAETDNAHTLSSGTPIEKIYADHSNRMKALANEARRVMVNTKSTPYSPSAKKAYSAEVTSLNAKLNIALRNAPLERQAQILANAWVRAKRQESPDMEPTELKKIKAQALTEARIRTGARKQRIDLTPREWEAIQAGAISTSTLEKILANTDVEQIKALATPKTEVLMTPVKQSRAEAMLRAGYTQADVADALGVSLTTLKTAIK